MDGNKGMKTEPRRLHPALLRNMDGNVIDWNLQAHLQIGEELLPLNPLSEGGQALGTSLRRKAAWNALRDEADHLGQQLTHYSSIPLCEGDARDSNSNRKHR